VADHEQDRGGEKAAEEKRHRAEEYKLHIDRLKVMMINLNNYAEREKK
jgi:hypothetical protein